MIWIVPKGLSYGVAYSQLIQPVIAANQSEEHIILVHNKDRHLYEEIGSLTLVSYGDLREMRKVLTRQSNFYTRSIFDFFVVYFCTLFKKRIVHYSFRGLAFAESYYKNRNIAKKLILFLLEFLVYHLAHELSCVSHQMKLELSRIFLRSREIQIRHCGISRVVNSRKTFNDTLHFVYVGGLSQWQKVKESVALYNQISESIDRPTKLTIVTRDTNLAKRKLSAIDKHVESISYLSLKPSEVTGFLQTCDFGFLLRDFSLVNIVASPIKFLEYTSSGVVPIVSPFIGDYSQHVAAQKLGICLSGQLSDDDIGQKIIAMTGDESVFTRLHDYSSKFLHSTQL